MAAPQPVTVVNIQERLVISTDNDANPLSDVQMVGVDRLLVGVPVSEWSSVLEENAQGIMATITQLVFVAATNNYLLEQAYRKTTGTNPFSHFSACDVFDCITKQMAQPLEFSDYPPSATSAINYNIECSPRIPFRRDGTLVGRRSNPRIEICVDCFYDAQARKRIVLDQGFYEILLYGAIGFLIPDNIRDQLIANTNVYPEFTEESTVSDLGELVLKGTSDNQLMALLEVVVPVIR